MKNNQKKEVTMRPMYFQIDRQQDKPINITFEKDNLDNCDFVLVTSEEIHSNFDFEENEIIDRTKSWLKKSYPNGDWHYRVSKNQNHIFWKYEKTLFDRSERMASKQAA